MHEYVEHIRAAAEMCNQAQEAICREFPNDPVRVVELGVQQAFAHLNGVGAVISAATLGNQYRSIRAQLLIQAAATPGSNG